MTNLERILSFLSCSMLILASSATGEPDGSAELESVITVEYSTLWTEWKQRFNRTYATASEEIMRRVRWEKNIQQIEQHNRQYDLGKHSYNLGLNQFSDMDFSEFKRFYLTRETTTAELTTALNGSQFFSYLSPLNAGSLPPAVDWRKQGYVTPVKNQGRCGSCWAFSTTGSLEGQTYRMTRKLPSLSEQQLVDCSTSNKGCQGGMMDRAFIYIMQAKGITSEAVYPYRAQQGRCHFHPATAVAYCRGFYRIPQSEPYLAMATAQNGPISVAIFANANLMHYKSGIYVDPTCPNNQINHAVLTVGYGSSPLPFWIVKNSWGPGWGENGYFRMIRNHGNQCGIANYPMFPVV